MLRRLFRLVPAAAGERGLSVPVASRGGYVRVVFYFPVPQGGADAVPLFPLGGRALVRGDADVVWLHEAFGPALGPRFQVARLSADRGALRLERVLFPGAAPSGALYASFVRDLVLCHPARVGAVDARGAFPELGVGMDDRGIGVLL